MSAHIENWKTQIRKGYLELCILLLIEKIGRLYGFDLLDRMEEAKLPIKEGTLYPLLNRMAMEGTLLANWEIKEVKGHPRKFYSLTAGGKELLAEMKREFSKMNDIYEVFNQKEKQK